jgi:D-erythronate 2-dehydrogenase
MRVLVLGAGGFLGKKLSANLAASGHVAGAAITELLLFDQRLFPLNKAAVCPQRQLLGDLREATVLDALFVNRVDIIFHLAATLTLDAETDFRLGLETNLLSLVEMLERCRTQATTPMFLFASSIATFGGRLPAVVGDDVFQSPTTSYGTHKALAELLLVDYSRHGFIDGRALRLPIVVTHPGPATGSISDQVAALIREPLRGKRTTCRFARDSQIVVASADKVVDSLLHLAQVPSQDLQQRRVLNLPGLTVTPLQISQAVAKYLPHGLNDPTDWRADPSIQAMIDSWPKNFTSERALALDFTPDASADALVASFIAQEQSLL